MQSSPPMAAVDASTSVSDASTSAAAPDPRQVRVTKKSLQAVLEQCQRALQLLDKADFEEGSREEEDAPSEDGVSDADDLCNLLKSRVESPDFLEKLGSMHTSASQYISGENTSWDLVSTTDVLEDNLLIGENWSDKDDYVLVNQEDIVDGIACFMAAYLLSLKQTKDVNPNQLQEALSKTFSVKNKKGKLQKAWDGSKVIYSVASWSATAIGLYQNPALLGAASAAFWTSCRVISKFF